MNQSAIRGLVTNIVFVRQEGTLSTVVNKPRWLSTQLARVFSYRSPEYPFAYFGYHCLLVYHEATAITPQPVWVASLPK
jgi:hypothetical protein